MSHKPWLENVSLLSESGTATQLRHKHSSLLPQTMVQGCGTKKSGVVFAAKVTILDFGQGL